MHARTEWPKGPFGAFRAPNITQLSDSAGLDPLGFRAFRVQGVQG